MTAYIESLSQRVASEIKLPDIDTTEITADDHSVEATGTGIEIEDDGTKFEFKVADFIEAISHCANPIDAMSIMPVSTPVVSNVKVKAPRTKKQVEFDDRHRPIVPENCEIQIKNDSGKTLLAFVIMTGEGSDDNETTAELPKGNSSFTSPEYFWGKTYIIEYTDDGQIRLSTPELHVSNFMYAEHCLLGGKLQLQFPQGIAPAETTQMILENGISLTYGQINGLGGDYFGTYDPICKGTDFEDQCARFIRAYNCLAKQDRTKTELPAIMKERQKELDIIEQAWRNGQSTAEAYKKLCSNDHLGGHADDAQMEAATLLRANSGEYAAPSYLVLAVLNFDHFGHDARSAYAAGHYCALVEAAKGTPEALTKAYTMNAFADHYLGDCFAAGHLRTPRRMLHGSDSNALMRFITFAPDMCSKYMHDEDNAVGLKVCNAAGEWWEAYGDAKLFEDCNKENCRRLLACLQASADEVFSAFRSGQVESNVTNFAAFKHTPVPESAFSDKNHAALFKEVDGKAFIRKDLENGQRHEWREVTEYWYTVYRQVSKAKPIY